MAAFCNKMAGVRQQEVDKIENQADFGLPNTWLRRLGAVQHLKDFSNKKDLLMSLVSIEPDNVDSKL